jgi:predicted nucleotidyltransferase
VYNYFMTLVSSQPTIQIEIPRRKLSSFCRRWKVRELALFGSALRADFRPNSDIDLLVSFQSEAHWSLFDLVSMQSELRKIFGREVDLVERKAIETSPNYIRRRHILKSAQVIYAAR